VSVETAPAAGELYNQWKRLDASIVYVVGRPISAFNRNFFVSWPRALPATCNWPEI